MISRWQHTEDLNADSKQALSSLDQCFSLSGKLISQDPKSSVIRSPLNKAQNGDQINVYIKRYTQGGKNWRKYIGRSRVRTEWENLRLFKQWGINTPALLAYGETHHGLLGRFKRGALVTQEIPHSQTLEQLAEQKHALLNNWDLFKPLAKQIAIYTQILHKHEFTHNDLDWRNILVVPSSTDSSSHAPPPVYFLDCPGGRFWSFPWPKAMLRYRMMKDLAHLDKLARQHIPLRWRLWFYKQYTGRQKLNARDKRLLQQIHLFYDEKRYRKKWRL